MTAIFIDDLDDLGNGQTGWYDTMGDYGYLYIVGNSASDTTVNVFQVQSVSDLTGYYGLNVTYVSGSLPTNANKYELIYAPRGITGASGGTGPQGLQGAQGSQGAQGFQGAKPAIVPIQTFLGEEYVELLCVEMPEVYFEDIMVLKAGNQGAQSIVVEVSMDKTFVQVCEPGTIKVTGAMPSVPALVGAKVQGPAVVLAMRGEDLAEQEVDVVVRLSGIRAGMVGRRFAKRTYDQMVKNNRFWEQWSQ